MDAEILFFMSTKDQSDFLEKANEYCDSVLKRPNSSIYDLNIGSGKLYFTPSIFDENTLFIGKLEIRLSESTEAVSAKDHEIAKSTFRKLRNWLKKHYWSRLAYKDIKKNNKLTPSRNYWLGPDAKLWKEVDQVNHLLKLSKTNWMIFELGY